MIDWEIHGRNYTNCSCAYGCPCQFNALPTYGYCRAIAAIEVDTGRFGDTRLDGQRVAFSVAWPGPIHEGRGTMQPIIDERADDAQVTALLSIVTGRETDPMATAFAIYAAMCDTIHEPIRTRIDLDLDFDKRLATYHAHGVATGRGEPIRNPVTQKEHRAAIVLPNGAEFATAEVGRGWAESTGSVPMTLEDTHAHWAEIHMNGRGRIH